MLSRIWMINLALVTALMLALALLVPKPAARALTNAHGYKLDLVQHNAHLLLKLDTRESIDAVAAMAQDARLSDTLAQATAKSRETSQLQSRANAVMLKLISQIKPAG